MSYIEIEPNKLNDNLFRAVGDEWMLLSAVNDEGKVNTMTASWGCFGVLWNKPVAVCFIRPQRYTLGFVEQASKMTFTVLKDGYRDALRICGTKSGRDCDKITEAGLHVKIENGLAFFDEARLTVIGRKMYVGKIEKDGFCDELIRSKNYPSEDYHKVFICEIEKILKS